MLSSREDGSDRLPIRQPISTMPKHTTGTAEILHLPLPWARFRPRGGSVSSKSGHPGHEARCSTPEAILSPPPDRRGVSLTLSWRSSSRRRVRSVGLFSRPQASDRYRQRCAPTMWKHISPRCSTGVLRRQALEGRAVIRELLHSSGDLSLWGSRLHVRLNRLGAPRYAKALISLCDTINAMDLTIRETSSSLRFRVKPRPESGHK